MYQLMRFAASSTIPQSFARFKLPFLRGLCAILCLGVALAQAQAENPDNSGASAHQLAEEVKNQLVQILQNKASIEADGGPEAYAAAITEVFAPVVDYPLVARYVMGSFYEQASEAQRQAFANKLETGLMRSVVTYSQALAASGDYHFEVLPPKGDISGQDRVAVGLEARAGESVNQLTFHLLKVEEQWRLINLILGKANMGDLLKAQFAAAMLKNKGDLDQTVQSWGA